MEESIKYSILLELYGSLLTEKQFELLDYYYNQDLGLSEIAENLGITRQAVRDNLKKGENNLIEIEEKLQLFRKIRQQKEKLSEICSEINGLDIGNDIKKKLIKEINDLI